MQNTGTIYGLVDPRTNKIRYVGQTIRPLKGRLRDHINETKHPKFNTKKINWLKSLINKELSPTIVCLEWAYKEDLDEKEKYWITVFKDNDLVNLTDGGKDGVCREFYQRRTFYDTTPVYSFNEFTKEIVKYTNHTEAMKAVSKTDRALLWSIIRDKKRYLGLLWAFNPEDFKNFKVEGKTKFRAVVLSNDVETLEFFSVKEAMKYLKISQSKHNPIQARLNNKFDTYGAFKGIPKPYCGYYWKYKNEEANLKSDKLLETPEEDNQQPIITLNE